MVTTTKSGTEKAKKSTFRKVSEWLHLWIGLISGIVVFIVCFTGGIWVWRYEVWQFTEGHYQRVEPQQKAFMLPSQLGAMAKAYVYKQTDTLPDIHGVTYGKPFKAVIVGYEVGKRHSALYMNPYTGEVLKDKREASPAEKFFIWVRAGHRFIWLPQPIGSPIAGTGCILFLITLITGLIWWWPKKWTAKTREKSFKIKWSANWKRLNIDLHNVLGFYSLLFVAALTITGVMFSFKWFQDGVYSALTWKAAEKEIRYFPKSDTLATVNYKINKAEDIIFTKMYNKYGKDAGRIDMDYPEKMSDAYRVIIQFGDGTLIYNNIFHFYDSRTLKEIPATASRTKPYDQLSLGEKTFRMDFDIHTGQILGLPTKIIAFLACMIGAGLPVTGTIIWYNRKWGKKKSKKKKVLQVA